MCADGSHPSVTFWTGGSGLCDGERTLAKPEETKWSEVTAILLQKRKWPQDLKKGLAAQKACPGTSKCLVVSRLFGCLGWPLLAFAIYYRLKDEPSTGPGSTTGGGVEVPEPRKPDESGDAKPDGQPGESGGAKAGDQPGDGGAKSDTSPPEAESSSSGAKIIGVVLLPRE